MKQVILGWMIVWIALGIGGLIFIPHKTQTIHFFLALSVLCGCTLAIIEAIEKVLPRDICVRLYTKKKDDGATSDNTL